MNILFMAAEAAPFASTGGLGEVIASLPMALDALEINCRVLVPAYKKISVPCETLAEWLMDFDGNFIAVTLKKVRDVALPLYLLDIPAYFDREQLYGYADDILRFGAFCQASLLAQKYFSTQDWDADVVHCHDWHTALFPVYHNISRTPAKVLLTIHNLAYQGVCDPSYVPRLGLPASLFNLHQLEFWGQLNPFKGGLVFADAISTVSPTYAMEIQKAEFGCGLEDVLKERNSKLFGVINGIDQTVWNPEADRHLAANFDAQNISGKDVCKSYLQKLGGLSVDSQVPLIGMVTRLAAQKGLDLLLAAFDEILSLGIQLAVLGDGDAELIAPLKVLSQQYPTQFFLTAGVFDVSLAHQIYAGSDMFLMPSRFEPCGLAQMISMRYGTIPIVRATGGLADTVRHFSATDDSGNGFVFKSYAPKALVDTIAEATECFKSTRWKELQQNAFNTDFSWRQSATQYKKIYDSL